MPMITCDHQEGNFAEGQTIVLCTATDAAMNFHTCTFSVTLGTE